MQSSYRFRDAFTLLEALVVFTIIGVGALLLFSFAGCFSRTSAPAETADGVKLKVTVPSNSETSYFDVIVNNNKVGRTSRGEPLVVTFPAAPDGNNVVQFVAPFPYQAISPKSSDLHPFNATPGAELNATVVYISKTFGPDQFDVDIRVTKAGEPPSIEGIEIEPTLIRREAHKETVRGLPGSRYTVTRTRVIEREIQLSESSKTALSGSVGFGFGLVQVSATIKTTAAQKDTVFMRDKEEIKQSIDVLLADDGTTTIVWIDSIKKGKATYKFNGRTKQLEFEVLYSSELNVLRK